MEASVAGLSDLEPLEREAADDIGLEEVPANAPPAVTVLVDLSGTGTGTISGSVTCSGQNLSCSVSAEAGATLTFTAAAGANAIFTGWTGACTGTSATCTVPAADHRLVVATFRASAALVTSYYHLDALGSVRAITDGAGAVLERHDYRPFGEDTMPLPAPGADPSRFLGQPRDGTKLDEFGARYYSMFTGRFHGVDPVVSAGAVVRPQLWNRYAYTANNPLRFTDATGLEPVEELETPLAYEDAGSPDRQAFTNWASNLSATWSLEAAPTLEALRSQVNLIYGVDAADLVIRLAAVASSELPEGTFAQYSAIISTAFNRAATPAGYPGSDRGVAAFLVPRQYQGIGNDPYRAIISGTGTANEYQMLAFLAASNVYAPDGQAYLTTSATAFLALKPGQEPTDRQVRALGRNIDPEPVAVLPGPEGSHCCGSLYLYNFKLRPKK